jgi:hypothetical protein
MRAAGGDREKEKAFCEEKAMSGATKQEMHVDGLRFEGFLLCPGCEEAFVLEGYCIVCARLNESMERKRLEGQRFLEKVERHDLGVVPFEAKPDDLGMAPFETHEFFIIGAVLAVSACFFGVLGVGLWFTGKAAIGALLELSSR